jgi:hypothetical protein
MDTHLELLRQSISNALHEYRRENSGYAILVCSCKSETKNLRKMQVHNHVLEKVS